MSLEISVKQNAISLISRSLCESASLKYLLLNPINKQLAMLLNSTQIDNLQFKTLQYLTIFHWCGGVIFKASISATCFISQIPDRDPLTSNFKTIHLKLSNIPFF